MCTCDPFTAFICRSLSDDKLLNSSMKINGDLPLGGRGKPRFTVCMYAHLLLNLLLYQEILEAKRQRHVKKAELGKRRSAASQNRMRIISSLGAEATVKKGKRNKEDTFGMDDEDWNVYRAIVSIIACAICNLCG